MLMSSKATPQHGQRHLEDTQPASDSQIERSLGRDSGKSSSIRQRPSRCGNADEKGSVPSPTSPAPASVTPSSASKPDDTVPKIMFIKFC